VKSIIGLLGWGGVVLVVAAVAIRLFRPEWQPWSQRLALAGLIVVILYAITQWRDIGRSFQGKGAKYGSIAIGSVLVFLAIVVGINWIANRQNKRWDLTEGSQFSMSDQTRQVLTSLKEPVKVQTFYTPDVDLQSIRDVFDEYAYLTGQFTVEYIDALKSPAIAQQEGVTSVPLAIMRYRDRTERVQRIDEQSVTNALKKLMEGQAKKIFAIQGHGERDITDSSAQHYSTLVAEVKNDNFEVLAHNLPQQMKVPDEATIVMVAGPTIDYLPQEIDLLRGYLNRGGKLWLMLDPPTKVDDKPLTNLLGFAREFGIDVGTNIVLDASGLGQAFGAGPQIPLAMPAPGGHPITRNLRVVTAFPLARSITVQSGASGKYPQLVAQTGQNGWAEADLKTVMVDGRPEPDGPGDIPGPVGVMAAVSWTPTNTSAANGTPSEARLVVVGDSDFLANRFLGVQGNLDMGLNIANWLAQQEDLISIRPRDPEDRRIELTADQQVIVFWGTIAVIPLLLAATGLRIWWKRR
jgi:ABC-type uncharacterized transport system involved in gliding motility auxiliary subunit